jgi:hypothetical protein
MDSTCTICVKEDPKFKNISTHHDALMNKLASIR